MPGAEEAAVSTGAAAEVGAAAMAEILAGEAVVRGRVNTEVENITAVGITVIMEIVTETTITTTITTPRTITTRKDGAVDGAPDGGMELRTMLLPVWRWAR
jgi:hypothetical protein